MKWQTLDPWRKTYYRPRQHIKTRDITANKSLYSQNFGFASSHVWMWELDQKEGWELKAEGFRIVVLEKTLENPLDCKEIKPINPKGNQPWIFIGRISAEAEAPKLWPPDAKSQFIGKDPDAWKESGQEEKARTEMRWLDGIIDSMDISLSTLWACISTGKPGGLQSMGSQRIKGW